MNIVSTQGLTIDSAELREKAQHLFDELRTLTADESGVTREAFAKGEQAALDLLSAYARAHGLKCTTDGAGSLIVSLPNDDLTTPGLIVGSHADSVPQGGNFDGGAGLIAGLLCLIRLAIEGRSGGGLCRRGTLGSIESAAPHDGFPGRGRIGLRHRGPGLRRVPRPGQDGDA